VIPTRLDNAIKHLRLIAADLPSPAAEAIDDACSDLRRAIRILHADAAAASSPEVARVARMLGGAVERVEAD
jgi:hypothetical protein